MNSEKQKSFKVASVPLIEWLRENVHPHHIAIVTQNDAELLEGVCATGPINNAERADQAIAALDHMPDDEALLRQALEALDPCDGVRWGGMGKVRAAAIKALRERLK